LVYSFSIHSLACINIECTYFVVNETLLCENYINLNALQLNLTGPINNLILKPLNERANSFNEQLVVFFDKIKTNFTDNYSVWLENFIDFDISFNPFNLVNKQANRLVMDRSILDFKNNGMNVNCASYVGSTQDKMFAKFKEILFHSNMLYKDDQCPVIFGASKLDRVVFNGIDSIENSFSFANLTGDPTIFTSDINNVEFLRANLRVLNSRVLNPDVFRRVEKILYSTENVRMALAEIEIGLFAPFQGLNRLELALTNYAQFVKTSNFRWLSSLNPRRTPGFRLIFTGRSIIHIYLLA
jgi:hypothetical protein